MKTLIIDNYDSFTHNLYQLVAGLDPEGEAAVIRNDAVDLEGVLEMDPTHVILSPGPGHPGRHRDFGVCEELVRFGARRPILGVCLGHQGIVHHLGGAVVKAPSIVHGKTSRVTHDRRGLFAGLSQGMEVMRYHSLTVCPQRLPDFFRVTARSEDGQIMAVAHRRRPLFGVQFHPESIGTPEGGAILSNFLEMRCDA